MRRVIGILAAAGALVTAGAASSAYAQSRAHTQNSYDLQQPAGWSPSTPARSLQWNGKGRWGLNFEYQQPTTRDVQWNDVNAGVFFRPSPRLRVGAAVNLATGQPSEQPRFVTPDEKPQPRVRLETLFRF